MQRFLGLVTEYAAGILVLVFTVLGIAIMAYGMFVGEFLPGLADIDRARGLITFLFSMGLIAIFFITVIVTFLTSDPELKFADKLDKVKDLLTMLTPIFGTIVGFYFGTESQGNDVVGELKIGPTTVSDTSPDSGTDMMISSLVSGGDSPYNYSITFSAEPEEESFSGLDVSHGQTENGLIVHSFPVPAVQEDTTVTFTISISDDDSKSAVLPGPEMFVRAKS